ncbi:MAG TPA: DUF4271 domain-containing protein [Bacteroidia bacterium]|jgi:hypothetical protein|nr:DUF4271 domain-containing protein [Bacteroidia bacterium]
MRLKLLLIVLQLQSLGTNGFHPKLLPSSHDNWWIAAVLFTCFTLLIMLRVFDYRRLLLLFNAFIRVSTVSVAYREESVISSRVSVFLLINYLLMMAIFARSVARFLGIDPDGLQAAGTIMLLLVAAYFIKIAVTRIIGSIFDLKELSREYAYNILLFNKAIGLVLFPTVLLLAYARQIPSDFLVWVGILSIAIILIYRLLRVFLIGMGTSSVSLFYLILYLCTLEFLPFVVLIKLFMVNFQEVEPLQTT